MLAQQLAVSSNILLGKVIFSLVKKERLVYWLLWQLCQIWFCSKYSSSIKLLIDRQRKLRKKAAVIWDTNASWKLLSNLVWMTNHVRNGSIRTTKLMVLNLFLSAACMQKSPWIRITYRDGNDQLSSRVHVIVSENNQNSLINGQIPVTLVSCFLKMRPFRFFNQYKGKNEGFDGAVPRDIVGKS